MIQVSQWLRMTASPKTGTELSVCGQGPGIGISTLHMVGFLGKGSDSCRASSEDCCPACILKGQKWALRTYRISFSESICLCENPQCIYPLGKPPILITSPGAEESQQQQSQKRRLSETTSLEPCSKQRRTDTSFGADWTLNTDLDSQHNGNTLCKTESCLLDLLQDGQHKHYESGPPPKQNAVVDESALPPKQNAEVDESELPPKQNAVADAPALPPKQNAVADAPALPPKQNAVVETAATCNVAQGVSPESVHSDSGLHSPRLQLYTIHCQAAQDILGPQLVSTPFSLQWRNKDALCWLDCILSALVQSVTLKKTVTEACAKNEESVVQKLFTEYNKASALLAACPMKAENLMEVSIETLAQAETCLNEIRRAIFDQLHPQLKCELGKHESPVFAFPLLLKKDPWLEKLFLHSFSWHFECALCGYKHQQRCTKNLTTFTTVVPEWHPLNGTHVAPCNNCQDKMQRRKMILESVSSVFMLHFVEGLPDNRLKAYSFQFEGDSYEISTVIQYRANHFVTWTLNGDGSWFEYDDLKGPYCGRHEKFGVPATEIHIVCWEKICTVPRELNSELQGEKTPSPAVTNVQSGTPVWPGSDDNREAVTKFVMSPKQPFSSFPKNKSQNENMGKVNDLLSGLEGLAADDDITLTLVEVQVDSEGKPVENSYMPVNQVYEQNSQQQANASVPFSSQASQKDDKTEKESLSVENSIACPVLSKFCPTPSPVVASPRNNNVDLPTIVQVYQPPSQMKSSEHKNKAVAQQDETISSPAPVQNSRILQRKTVADPQSAVISPVKNVSQENQKKGFVGSWVKSLLSKHPSFMPSALSVSTCNHEKKSYRTESLLQVNGVNLPTKGADSFDGFKAKGISKTVRKPGKVTMSACKKTLFFSSPSAVTTLPTVDTGDAKKPALTNVPVPINKILLIPSKEISSPSHQLISTNNQSGDKHHKPAAKHRELTKEEKIHKLRLKLLKKIKTKKNELASLDMTAKAPKSNEGLLNNSMKYISDYKNHSDCDILEDFLNALRRQSSSADSEPVCPLSSSTSMCSSPSDDEFLAELLSPATTAASTDMSRAGEEDSRFLEMLVDGSIETFLPSNLNKSLSSYGTATNQVCDYSPNKEIPLMAQADSLSNKSLENTAKEDIIEDLLSSTMLNSLGDTEYLPHFDENLFENF
ncbi:SUMO-specific isopeptidase USPL1 [Microcaecilia unicolor]|uniref:SUMO-specific isopeptidase USPL1 n=1 Tax=Microcaecilia unicolor TaxID=1415580 RepID=A0A6P7XT50_9AMPH|nr:SUMO-specific isopeptidase USPL1 [Microcaecilia unicolor]XP_030056221.1 SUMO-specific isopeptidase USPL1 [Microcaecilia unicolor]